MHHLCVIFFTVSTVTLVPTIASAQEVVSPAITESGPAWSPYIVGGLIGVLSLFTFLFSDKPLGASTAYARVAGLIGLGVAPRHTKSLKYYKDTPPAVDWEVMLVVGAVIGAFLAAWHGGELTNKWIPSLWANRFGSESLGLRPTAAIIGGVLMAFGARRAGGCTSGHGISGAMQLSVGSWIAVICFFLGGIATAMLMFRV